jgi:hypothetical protein
VAARENLIFNAPVPTEGMAGIANMLYFAGNEGINLRVGKYAPQNNHDIVLRDNYVAGGKIGLEMIEPWNKATVTGNTFIGSRDVVKVGGASLPGHYQWSGNTWVRDPGAKAWRDEDKAYEWDDWKRASGLGGRDYVLPEPPKTSKVFVRPNRYEPGRAHIVVYNWGGGATVAVDVSSVLKPGDRYEVRNVQALFNAPVVSGVYQGGAIGIPMTGVTPPAPIGRVTRTPPKTGPAFDVFLLTSPSR